MTVNRTTHCAIKIREANMTNKTSRRVNKWNSQFVIFFLLLAGMQGLAYANGFVFTVPRDSPTGITPINNLLTDMNPEVALFVTRRFNATQVFDPEPVGVRYLRGKWRIENLNGEPIRKGSTYNVLVLPQNHPSVYIHQNKNRGQINVYSGSYYTTLHHPKLDGRPNARFLITARRVEGHDSPNNAHSIGAYYHNGFWRIYNKDRQIMPWNVIFNIFIGEIDFEAISGTNRDIVRYAGRSRIRLPGQFSIEDTLFVAQRNLKQPSGEEDDVDEIAIYRQEREWFGRPPSERWWIFNSTELDPDPSYSVYRHSFLSTSPRYRVYNFDQTGVSREYASHPPLLMYDPSRGNYGELAVLDRVEFNDNGNISFTEAPSPSSTRRKGFAYIHHDRNSASKFLKAKNGIIIGRYTVSGQKLFSIHLDFNQDNIVDYIEFHNAGNKSVSILVLESEIALENFRDILEGQNIFCRYKSGYEELPDPSNPSSQYGSSANTNSVILGCNKHGLYSGGGLPSFNVGNLAGSGSDGVSAFMDQLCAAHTNVSGGGGLGLVGTDPEPDPIDSVTNPADYDDAEEIVGDALIAAGDAVIDEANRWSRGSVVGAPIVALGGSLRILGKIWKLSYEATRDPGPIPEIGAHAPNWAQFCRDRALLNSDWSLRKLEQAVRQNDCPSPVEHVRGIAMSTGGNTPNPPPIGPYQPRRLQTLEGTKFCQNHQQNSSYSDVWDNINKGQCDSPYATVGQPDRCNDPILRATVAGSLEIGAADVLAPEVANNVRKLLEKVVNPGDPLYR